MSGTVMTEQTGETGEVINKSPAHTPSRTSAKSLTGPETRCRSLGWGGRWAPTRGGRRAECRLAMEQHAAATSASVAEEAAIPAEEEPHPWHQDSDLRHPP